MRDHEHIFRVKRMEVAITFRVTGDGEINGWRWGDAYAAAEEQTQWWLRYLAGAYRDGRRDLLDEQRWAREGDDA